MTGPGTETGDGDGEGWDTGTIEEEDAIMAEAARLMKLWKVPADFRQFLSDCCRLVGGWENELAIRKWSFQLLKAAHADGSMFSGHWDDMAYTASLPVPMPAWLFQKAKQFECESVVMVDVGETDGDSENVKEVVGGEMGEDGSGNVEVEKGEGLEEEEVAVMESASKEGEGGATCGIEEEEEEKAESLSSLPPFWGVSLPPAASCEETPKHPWRPWEGGEVIGGDEDSVVVVEERREGLLVEEERKETCYTKRRSKAAAARSLGRLLRWQEKLEPQLGPSRLQLQLRCATPSVPGRELRRTNLASKFDGGKAEPCLGRGVYSGDEGGPGAQGSPQPGVLCQDLVVGREGEERRGLLGLGANKLSAGTFQPFPLLQQLTTPLTPNNYTSFPTPPPSGGYRIEWKGERRELPGSGDGGQGLYASGFQHFTSLLQIPTTISSESSFPTPPPPPSWSAKWRGDWWLVPAGMSTQCASCRLWGPLSPGG